VSIKISYLKSYVNIPILLSYNFADPSGLALKNLGLRPLVWRDSGFEFVWGHRCLSVVSVVCCVVVVSASSWSLVQSSPTDCGVSEYDRGASILKRLTRNSCAMEKKCIYIIFILGCYFGDPSFKCRSENWVLWGISDFLSIHPGKRRDVISVYATIFLILYLIIH